MLESNCPQRYAIHKYMVNAYGKQEGDPIRLAQLMIHITTLENPPLRLPLGKIALKRIAVKSETQAKKFQQYADLARSADYET